MLPLTPFSIAEGCPPAIKVAVVEELVTACKQVKLQSSAPSAVKQKNAVRGAISILFYSDKVMAAVMKQCKGALPMMN